MPPTFQYGRGCRETLVERRYRVELVPKGRQPDKAPMEWVRSKDGGLSFKFQFLRPGSIHLFGTLGRKN
jgi:hypothetical protein